MNYDCFVEFDCLQFQLVEQTENNNNNKHNDAIAIRSFVKRSYAIDMCYLFNRLNLLDFSLLLSLSPPFSLTCDVCREIVNQLSQQIQKQPTPRFIYSYFIRWVLFFYLSSVIESLCGRNSRVWFINGYTLRWPILHAWYE